MGQAAAGALGGGRHVMEMTVGGLQLTAHCPVFSLNFEIWFTL